MMRSVVLIFIFLLANLTPAQKTGQPEMFGRWLADFEDYQEFIYHRIETVKFYSLKDHPNGKVVTRICSQDNKMSLALANSVGFAFQLPFYTNLLQIPAEKIFFARSTSCSRSEEYWFFPEDITLDYDEIVSAEKVIVRRFLEESFDNPNSLESRREFAGNIRKFIEGLKTNPRADGFIILNLQTKPLYLQRALQEIRKSGIARTRFQILRKKRYPSNYPEFMTVSIKN